MMVVLAFVATTGCKKHKKDKEEQNTEQPGDKKTEPVATKVLVNDVEFEYLSGGLGDVLNGKTVTSLVWKGGAIDAKDVESFHEHCSATLKHLDISNVSFLPGPDQYDTGNKYYEGVIKKADAVPTSFCYGFNSLESVVMGSNIKSVDYFGFANTKKLNSVLMPSVTELKDYAFMSSGLSQIDLPEGLESIGTEAFYNVPLVNVYLPSTIKRFTNNTFIWYKETSKLVTFVCKAYTPPTVDMSNISLNQSGNVFNITRSDFVIYVPGPSVEQYKAAPGWSAHASVIKAMP